MSSPPVCHICSRCVPTQNVYAQKGVWRYLRCPGCGLVVLDNIPDKATLRAYYNDSYEVNFDRHIRAVRYGSRAVLDELRSHFPERGRLLEVGCSYGGFLAAAKSEGWDVTGIELSDTAASYARDRLGLNVISGTVERYRDRVDGLFDVVALFHVIEHVPEPIELLQWCRSLTRPNGLLVLKTPNVASVAARLAGAHWQWVSPPAHLSLYSRKTLECLLNKLGYKPLRFQSVQGDAHNNLFEIVCSVGKRTICRSTESVDRLRQTRYISIVETVCDSFYSPFRVWLDPWLGASMGQPELYALALKLG